MEAVFRIGLSNTLVALGLAIVAVAAGWLRLRPAMVHGLWVLVLVKLVTPPLLDIPTVAGRAWPWPAPEPSGGIARDPVAASRPGGPSGEYGVWHYQPRVPWVPPDPEAAERDRRRRVEGRKTAMRLVAEGRIPPLPGRPGPASPGPGDWGRRLSALVPPTSHLLALAAWFGVASLWWGRTAWRLLRFRRLLRWATPAPTAVQDQARGLAPRLGLRRTPEVWFVPAPISPMLWALATRPRLLVPEALWHRLTTDQRAALLAHELAHFRRRDHWVRPLEILATGLHWWNPLLWLARRALREVEERCCDAWVNSALPGRAKDYALAIVETIDYLADAPGADPMGATGLTSASRLKERLTRILEGATARPLSWPGTLALLGLTAAALGMRPGLPSPRLYRAMDLGSLGFEWTSAGRINADGQVVGLSRRTDGMIGGIVRLAPHAFRARPGRPIDPADDDLTVLVGAPDEPGVETFPWDIDGAGRILVCVKRSVPRTVSPPAEYRTFLVDGRRVLGLDRSAPRAVAINDAGLIAGTILRRRPEPDPVRPRPPQGERLRPHQRAGWDRIGFRIPLGRPVASDADELGHLGGIATGGPHQGWGGHDNDVADMNARGQVVGTSARPDRTRHAYRTAPGRPIDPATDDLGALTPAGSSEATAVNDRGQVVGWADSNAVYREYAVAISASGDFWEESDNQVHSNRHAFRTAPNRPIDPATDDLGTLGGPDSTAYGINNRGDVVGKAQARDGEVHAFLFTEGRMIDLNACVALPAGWVLVRARGINDRGQIIADAIVRRNVLDPLDARQPQRLRRAYVLTPAPEPIPLAMLVIGTAITAAGLAPRWRGARRMASPRGPGEGKEVDRPRLSLP